MAIDSTWKDRWVCIGGGTSGLGLVLAQQFTQRGANVAIIGRDHARAALAADKLRKLGTGTILAFCVDLSDEQAIRTSEWMQWLSKARLDVAIAAAGKSDRGFVTQLTQTDLEELFRINLFSSFNFSKVTEDALARGHGSLVHIASLAGIVAKPGMGGYSMVKHAVVAMSRQLRTELVDKGIHVLLVCPGPVQRDSSTIGRYDELVEERQLPESLKKPAGGTNLKAIAPQLLAEKIVAAIEQKKKELILPAKARWLAGLSAIWPGILDYLFRNPKKK
ncbi:MAG: SDR family NAD(P)-dependent oxidoreductase [Pirellulaceae bacterium]|nr:SDR family NAD(P)-dependent oxidoreductase [Pirellulaceae bacterium]